MKAVNIAYNDFDTETGKRDNGETISLKGSVDDSARGYEEIPHIRILNPVDDTGKVTEVSGVVLMFRDSKEKKFYTGKLLKFLS